MVAIWIIVSLALVLAVVRLAAWLAKGTRDQRCPTMIVLGSGGHTAEMLRLLRNFDPAAYSPRAYVTAQTDTLSGQKAVSFESSWASSASDFKVARIPRSREVGQSWISSAFSTIYAMFFAVALVFKERPDLVSTLYSFVRDRY